MGDGPAIFIGSSLGGYLAALFASRHSYIEKVVLMAPAFQFPRRLRARYSPEDLARWKLQAAFRSSIMDARKIARWATKLWRTLELTREEPEFPQPALILHGMHDEVVPVEISRMYAARHANVALRVFESGHELTNVLEDIFGRKLFFFFSSDAAGGSVYAFVVVVNF